MVEKVGFLGSKLNILSLKRTMIFGLKKKIKKVEKEQNLGLNQDYDVKKKIGFMVRSVSWICSSSLLSMSKYLKYYSQETGHVYYSGFSDLLPKV